MADIKRNAGRTFLLGGIVILLGVLLLMSNLGMLQFGLHDIIFSWKALIIVVGLIMIVNGNYRGGWVMIVIGSIFLISDYYYLDIRTFWPVVLIVIGVYLLFGIPKRRYYRHWDNYRENYREKYREQFAENVAEHVSAHFKEKYDRNSNPSSEDFLNEIAVFSGSKKTINSQNFQGGKLTAIFGGIEVDLYDCKLAPGNNVLEVVAIFGGITMYIPRDWKVIVDVTPIFGGFSDERRKDPNMVYPDDRVLIIKGTVLFGGGEIKSA
ncbi:MAG: LiaF transmembrane domain-containing protein [Ignavibacteriales bacterium]